MSDTGRARPRRAWLASPWAIVALVLVGGALRWAVMERTFPVRPVGDEYYYLVVASKITNSRGHVYGGSSRALRPPGHPWLLSRFVEPNSPVEWPPGPGGPSLRLDALRPVLRLQVVLGALLVGATALLGRALFGARVGTVAGALAAFYPTLIAYTHYLFSETLFALLATLGLLGIAVGQRRDGLALPAATGLVFGAAALTREIALPVAGAGVAWWWWTAEAPRRRRAALRGALLLACAVLTVVPWTLRNYHLLGRLVPVSTVGWMAAAEGNALEGSRWLQHGGSGRQAFRREFLSLDDEVERLDFARRRTFELIRAEQPTWIFEKIARHLTLLLSPEAFQFRKLKLGAYGDVPAAVTGWLWAVSTLAWALVFGAGVLGIAAARSGGRWLLPCLVLALVVGVHVLANATPRFRVPWLPLLMAYAGYALVGGRAVLRDLGALRWTAVGLSAGLFTGVCAAWFLLGLHA